MSRPEIYVDANADAAAMRAAAETLTLIRRAVALRGRAAVALAGGTTPGVMYRHLAASGRAGAPWDQVDFFFGDERCVPSTSPHSNYAFARRELLDPLGIADTAVRRVETGISPAELAAEAYEACLRGYFGSLAAVFDLILLGVGADGHTASLFPGNTALDEVVRWVVVARAPAAYEVTERVTLTLPVLNQARAVFFLAAGAAKRAAVAGALDTPPAGAQAPAARVRPAGRLAWYLDRAAAGHLAP